MCPMVWDGRLNEFQLTAEMGTGLRGWLGWWPVGGLVVRLRLRAQ